jgi:hypothetical protein
VYGEEHAMGQSDVELLKTAIERKHGGTAWFARKVPIMARFEGGAFWAGIVYVFDLSGHPKADRVYAWAYRRGGGEMRFFASLHSDRINSPEGAVRSSVRAAGKAASTAARGTVG